MFAGAATATAAPAPCAPQYEVTATIPTATQPTDIALLPDGSRAYVASVSGQVQVVNTSTNAITANITLPGYQVLQVATSPDGKTVYALSRNASYLLDSSLPGTVSVIDTATNTVTATIPVGNTPNTFALSPDGTTLYVGYLISVNSTGTKYGFGGVIDVIDTTTKTVAGSFPISSADAIGTVAMRFSEDGSFAYLVLSSGQVQVFDTATRSSTAAITVGASPYGVAFSPDGSRAYVPSVGSGTVSVIDTARKAVIGTVDLDGSPIAVAVSPDGNMVYVSDYSGGSVAVIDASTNAVITRVPVGTQPARMAVTSDGRHIYVPNAGSNTVSLLTMNLCHTVTFDTNGGSGQLADQTSSVSAALSANTFTRSGYTMTGWNTAADGSGTAYADGATFSFTTDLTLYAQWSAAADWVRLAGPDRYGTAAAVAEHGFSGTADTVYVATGLNFPDALTAGPVAAREKAPILLTDQKKIPAATSTALKRLHPSSIVVVGGTGAVSASVASQLARLDGVTKVTRIGGIDRYETSRLLADRAFANGATSAFVATGVNYPDALSASAPAGKIGAPILLVNGTKTNVDAATKAQLTKLKTTTTYVVGGTGVITDTIEDDLPDAIRLAGMDRYATNLAVAKRFYSSAENIYVATGRNFPDALVGGVLATLDEGPLLLATKTAWPAATLSYAASLGFAHGHLLGGTGVLDDNLKAMNTTF